MDSDRPITTRAKDRLGFDNLARHIANIVAENEAQDGFVLGIEGEWGSGKSSLLALIKEELEAHNNPPLIMEFKPWLVGSRDKLILEFWDYRTKRTLILFMIVRVMI